MGPVGAAIGWLCLVSHRATAARVTHKALGRKVLNARKPRVGPAVPKSQPRAVVEIKSRGPCYAFIDNNNAAGKPVIQAKTDISAGALKGKTPRSGFTCDVSSFAPVWQGWARTTLAGSTERARATRRKKRPHK